MGHAYYTTDAQGSTRQEVSENQLRQTSSSGTSSSARPKPNSYYAYGSPVNPLNPQSQKVEDTYTGQKKDEETNLMFYNARYYNPNTGIFLQADSVDDGQNKYQYVAGDPVNSTDPSGNCWFGFIGLDCQEKTESPKYIGNLNEYEKKAVEYALTFYPDYLIKDINIEKIDDQKHEVLAYVTDDEPTKIKVGWVFKLRIRSKSFHDFA